MKIINVGVIGRSKLCIPAKFELNLKTFFSHKNGPKVESENHTNKHRNIERQEKKHKIPQHEDNTKPEYIYIYYYYYNNLNIR